MSHRLGMFLMFQTSLSDRRVWLVDMLTVWLDDCTFYIISLQSIWVERYHCSHYFVIRFIPARWYLNIGQYGRLLEMHWWVYLALDLRVLICGGARGGRLLVNHSSLNTTCHSSKLLYPPLTLCSYTMWMWIVNTLLNLLWSRWPTFVHRIYLFITRFSHRTI